jgi:N-acetylmuramoyl-L-alanine amidase
MDEPLSHYAEAVPHRHDTRVMKANIKRGQRSRKAADVQSRLRALGFVIADEAGYFGPSTTAAVKAFQQRRGLLADGIVGPNTWGELVEASWRLGDRLLYLKQPFMRGDDVLALQARLNALGFDSGREDGIFGPDTDRAVRSFQKEYGVAEDGIFGPRSHAALVGLRVERPMTAAGLREELRLSEHSGVTSAVVVIDPGHGGADPGTRGPNGSAEVDLCWDIAERLAARLTGIGARVALTRAEGECPDTSERAQRANAAGADLFVSIHMNSHDKANAGGASTYFFGGSRAGERLAERVQRELVALGLPDCRSHPRSYQLLKETRMPAVLVEPGFISNPEDAARLADPRFRAAVADAIATAIRHYYEPVTAPLATTS